MGNPRLQGMSYEQASKEGCRLIQKAAESENWHSIVDDLVELRTIMKVKALQGDGVVSDAEATKIVAEADKERMVATAEPFRIGLLHSREGAVAVLPGKPLTQSQMHAVEVCLPVLRAANQFVSAELNISEGVVTLYERR